jgi:predicted Zn-dependent protease
MKSANPGLVLTITFAGPGDWEEVHFSLLTAKQEQELNAQLDFWEKHTDGVALRFGRAYSFSRQKLFAEAAEEYEFALDFAPDSRYLLQDVIQADRLAGRLSRAKELQSRLESQLNITNQ